ncbi:MAG TPA: class I SAM-dependent methyltransferase [Candidatus Bathyarchaeia archaeon]|nr:class I SAM-dependent methyltransferase [Candidatus Bathyarchaeia archaeon]
MGFVEKFVKQCRKPTGRFGKFVGRTMNLGHARIRHWGIGHISIKPDAYILDIGCGGGKAVQELAMSTPNGKVYGIDYSEDMVQLSKKVNETLIKNGLVEIKYGAVSSLPFADNMFDLVTAFEAYYFWPNLNNDLKEIKRVLKSEGTLLIVNEVYKDDKFEKRNTKWAKLSDMRLHTPNEYKDFLTKAGYHIVEIDNVPEKNWITAIAKKTEN